MYPIRGRRGRDVKRRVARRRVGRLRSLTAMGTSVLACPRALRLRREAKGARVMGGPFAHREKKARYWGGGRADEVKSRAPGAARAGQKSPRASKESEIEARPFQVTRLASHPILCKCPYSRTYAARSGGFLDLCARAQVLGRP